MEEVSSKTQRAKEILEGWLQLHGGHAVVNMALRTPVQFDIAALDSKSFSTVQAGIASPTTQSIPAPVSPTKHARKRRSLLPRPIDLIPITRSTRMHMLTQVDESRGLLCFVFELVSTRWSHC